MKPFKELQQPLSRIFRAEPPPPPLPPAPPSLEERIAALDLESPEQIVATILGDGDEALRAAAIGKLPDGATLRKLAGLGGEPAPLAGLERFAQDRVAQLIDEGTMTLAAIRDPQQLVQLVLEGSSSRLRQIAAQRIEGPEEIKRLLKQLRGKDKNVYRILKDKRDALNAEAQRLTQLENDIHALCASLEGLSHHFYDALYPPTFEHFEARWRALEGQALPAVRERAEQAIARCREVIAGHMREVAQQAAAAAQRSALQEVREATLAQAAEEAQRCDAAAALFAAAAAQLREAEQKARDQRLAAEALAVRQIGGLTNKARGALRDGQTGPAAGLRRAIESKLTALPVLPPPLARQLQELDLKLNELKAWKDYAVVPKRAELIAEMQALIGSSEHPKALADRVRDLREQWKTISKGIVIDSEADWQRFNQAAVTAYEPCREYFEAQAQVRAENLERRKSVLARFHAFENAQNGEHPDWRAISIVLHEARQEWRRIVPVDRVALKALQQEFDSARGRLQVRLDAWLAQNVAARKSLIQRAQALLTTEDGRAAVDAVKALQRQWQDAGPVPRNQDGPLWHEFHGHCDAVFQKRQQAFSEYAAALETSKAGALAICAEVEQVVAQSGTALLAGVAKIPQWRAAFEALGEMPRADERGLHDRFELALHNCQAALSEQRARDAELSFEHLFEAASCIRAYGRAVAQNADYLERAALKQAAETLIAGVPHWPKGAAAALQEAWVKADATAEPGMAANETELRTLCIRSEIAANLPTPPEDQARRRDYQLQRLVQSMGQGRDALHDEPDDLALVWVRIGPVTAAAHESLLARFLQCRQQLRRPSQPASHSRARR